MRAHKLLEVSERLARERLHLIVADRKHRLSYEGFDNTVSGTTGAEKETTTCCAPV